MNYLKILDDTLKSLKDNTDSRPLPKEYVLQRVNMLNKLSNRDIRLVFDKLKDDRYIDVIISNDLDKYFITFNGLLFLQKRGYRKQESIKKWNLRFKKTLNCTLFIASVTGIIFSVIQIKEAFCNDAKKTQTTININLK